MPVIGCPVAVDRDPHLDAMSVKHLAEVLVKQHPVGVNPQIEIAPPGQAFPQTPCDLAKPGGAGQQRPPPCRTT